MSFFLSFPAMRNSMQLLPRLQMSHKQKIRHRCNHDIDDGL